MLGTSAPQYPGRLIRPSIVIPLNPSLALSIRRFDQNSIASSNFSTDSSYDGCGSDDPMLGLGHVGVVQVILHHNQVALEMHAITGATMTSLPIESKTGGKYSSKQARESSQARKRSPCLDWVRGHRLGHHLDLSRSTL